MGKTNSDYWDCECNSNDWSYIHPKSEAVCSVCGVQVENQPDSRTNEVLMMKAESLAVEGIHNMIAEHNALPPYAKKVFYYDEDEAYRIAYLAYNLGENVGNAGFHAWWDNYKKK